MRARGDLRRRSADPTRRCKEAGIGARTGRWRLVAEDGARPVARNPRTSTSASASVVEERTYETEEDRARGRARQTRAAAWPPRQAGGRPPRLLRRPATSAGFDPWLPEPLVAVDRGSRRGRQSVSDTRPWPSPQPHVARSARRRAGSAPRVGLGRRARRRARGHTRPARRPLGQGGRRRGDWSGASHARYMLGREQMGRSTARGALAADTPARVVPGRPSLPDETTADGRPGGEGRGGSQAPRQRAEGLSKPSEASHLVEDVVAAAALTAPGEGRPGIVVVVVGWSRPPAAWTGRRRGRR